MSRTSLSISHEAKARFDEFKNPDETNEAAFLRLLDAAEGVNSDEFTDGVPEDVLTESHIDDLVAQTAARTADELESRLR